MSKNRLLYLCSIFAFAIGIFSFGKVDALASVSVGYNITCGEGGTVTVKDNKWTGTFGPSDKQKTSSLDGTTESSQITVTVTAKSGYKIAGTINSTSETYTIKLPTDPIVFNFEKLVTGSTQATTSTGVSASSGNSGSSYSPSSGVGSSPSNTLIVEYSYHYVDTKRKKGTSRVLVKPGETFSLGARDGWEPYRRTINIKSDGYVIRRDIERWSKELQQYVVGPDQIENLGGTFPSDKPVITISLRQNIRYRPNRSKCSVAEYNDAYRWWTETRDGRQGMSMQQYNSIMNTELNQINGTNILYY